MLAKRVYHALKTNDLGKLCNWALNKYEFSRRPLILRSYPITAHIEVTNNCPLHCIHCPRSYRDLHKIDMKLGSLNLDNFLKIIDKLRFVRHLILQGLGEPLLNADIFRMIEEARKRRFLVSFSTSASYFNKEIEQGLRRVAPDELVISLDSLEKKSFQEIRCNAAFEKFVKDLEAIIKAVRKSKRNSEIVFHCCVMKANSPHLGRIIEFAQRMKIKQIGFSELNLSYLESIKDQLVLGPEDYANVNEALRACRQKGIWASFTRNNGIKTRGKILCNELWQRIPVTWEGWVNICCGRPFSSVRNLGNILQADSFMQIWNSVQMQRLRQSVRENEVAAVCTGCPMANSGP